MFQSRTFSPKSWFFHVRSLCVRYGLPHPIDLLANPPEKVYFKNFVRKKVLDYWEIILRKESDELKSLTFFHPSFMSLSASHPAISSAGHSPAKVAMATIQIQMLSGRYRTDSLVRHWDKKVSGLCKLSTSCINVLEDLQHVLQICPALEPTRRQLLSFTENYLSKHSVPLEIIDVIKDQCNPRSSSFCSFIIDCSSNPLVIRLVQQHGADLVYGILFDVTRTWSYVLHRERLKLRGTWKRGRY